MYQTHSKKVIIINNKNKNLNKFKSDALVTKIKGIALGVVTADCVPIILLIHKIILLDVYMLVGKEPFLESLKTQLVNLKN